MGLVITSCGFIIPAILGLIKKRKLDTALSLGLAATSVWNHSRSCKIAKTVDVVYAHGVATYYVLSSSLGMLEKITLVDVYTLLGVMAISQVYYKKSRRSKLWHMGLHTVAIASWAFRIMAK